MAAAVSRSPAVVFSLAYIMGVVVATIVSVFVHGCLYKLQGCFACRLLACWRLAPWLAGLLFSFSWQQILVHRMLSTQTWGNRALHKLTCNSSSLLGAQSSPKGAIESSRVPSNFQLPRGSAHTGFLHRLACTGFLPALLARSFCWPAALHAVAYSEQVS